MDLRSRSRSNTPLLKQSLEREGNHVTRSTRRSTRLTESTRTEMKKSISQKNRYITSDYSSEEGEIVSSSGMDNLKNQLKEDMNRASVNGNSEISALKVYKEAGDYWNKFPKTDYTYSRHSKDRVELAPGVVAMPNMSRRSLHNASSGGILLNREMNTEESFYNSFAQKLEPQKMNNNKEESFVIHRRSIGQVSIYRKIIIYILKVCQFIFYPLFYLYNRQQSFFLWFGKTIHRIASRTMLFDTWILQKNVSSDKKLYGIITLCLLPLVLFGGLWMFQGIINGLSGWMSEPSGISHPVLHVEEITEHKITDLNPSNKFDFDDVGFRRQMVDLIENLGFFKRDETLTKNNEDEKDLLIDSLRKEIVKIREELNEKEKSFKGEILGLLSRIQNENKKNNEKLMKNSFVQIENYVSKVLKDLLSTGKFFTNEDLEEKIKDLKSSLDVVIENNVKVILNDVSSKISLKSGDLSLNTIDDRVKKIISEALAIYDADKTGLVDYAMESAGGQIVSTRCTESYQVKTAVVSILGIPVWYPSNTPRTVITPGVKPGDCWAFQNFPGFLLIKLSGFVKISGFSMEHLSVKLAPNGKVDSAPRDFEVYGLKSENDLVPVLLGTYKYLSNGEPLQFFSVQNDFDNFELVELRILSNHGNPNYTCLYRFRVHGELQNGRT